MRPEKLTDSTRRLIAEQHPETGVTAPVSPQEARETWTREYERGQEDKFQQWAESYLQRLGFWPRTRKAIRAGRPPAGWYLHHTEPRTNGIILDLLILPHDQPAIEIELKAKGGRLNEMQREILKNSNRAHICRTKADVRDWMLWYGCTEPERDAE